jgi:hypothetical protein
LPVEFVIHIDGLRQATDELKADRGKYSDTDFVDILVSEKAAIFRAVGTESEVPVDGTGPGSVRIPLRIVDKIAKALTSLKTKQLTFRCEPGLIKVGKLSFKHPDIELDKNPDQRLNLPINMSLLDTLALARIFPPSKIAEEGMKARVGEAEYSRRSAIADALAALQVLEIEDWQLSYFVDCHIQDAAKSLRKTLQGA